MFGLGPIEFLIWAGFVAICVLVGYWAGGVARAKGQSSTKFFALGALFSLLGLLPGIAVVVVAYTMKPVSST